MSTTVQVLSMLVTGIFACAVLVVIVRTLLFPPSALEGRVLSPAEQVEMERAELVVRRAIRGVRWPVMGLAFVTILISFHQRSRVISALVLCSGILVALVWQIYGTRRWWRWALGQGVDMDVVEELAEDAKLVSPPDSWWGRRERRTWMRLPSTTDAP